MSRRGRIFVVVSIADCQRVQTSWYRKRAEVLGGEVWTDGPLTWTDGPDGQNLMFPEEMATPAVRRGVERARDRGLRVVGAWLSLDTDATPLAEAGFERGWSPWWMTADLAEVTGRPDPRSSCSSILAITRENIAPTEINWPSAGTSRHVPGTPPRIPIVLGASRGEPGHSSTMTLLAYSTRRSGNPSAGVAWVPGC